MLRSRLQRLFGRNGERGRIVIARVLLVSFVLLFLGIGYVMSADAPKVQPAKLVKVTGDVSLLTPGSAAWRPANQRERILPGTKIRTGKNSSLLLELSPKNMVQVGANTEFSLDHALVRREIDPSQSIFFLSARTARYEYAVEQTSGRTVSILKGLGPNSRYEHRTPVAVAGVRGTTFLCDFPPKNTSGAKTAPAPENRGGGGSSFSPPPSFPTYNVNYNNINIQGQAVNWYVNDGSLSVNAFNPVMNFTVLGGQALACAVGYNVLVDLLEQGRTRQLTQEEMNLIHQILLALQDLNNAQNNYDNNQSSNSNGNSLDMNQLGSNPNGGSCYH